MSSAPDSVPTTMATEYDGVIERLQQGSQPAVRYRALTELSCLSSEHEEVRRARTNISKRGWAREILRLQRPDGTWQPDENLYQPKYLATNWMMLILTDLGLTSEIPGVKRACDLFFSNWLKPGYDESEHEVCVVGNLARVLIKCGYGDDPRVKRLVNWLLEVQKEDGGWHCFPSDTGTLDCWEPLAAFTAIPRRQWTRKLKQSVENGAEFYLERHLFNEGRRYKPWFRFHYPVHYYYDVLVGLDVLTALGYGGDRRLRPALQLLHDRRLSDGKWALDAVHPDLGPGAKYKLKREPAPFSLEEAGKPSKWVTLTAMIVLKRISQS